MSERRLTEHGAYSVLVIDMAHYDQANDMTIAGFPDLALARDYARRRTRSSLEELRGSNASHAVLKMAWSVFGEDCIVLGQDELPRRIRDRLFHRVSGEHGRAGLVGDRNAHSFAASPIIGI